MFFHTQNLNEDRKGNIKGSILKHGRCWWHFEKWTLGLEWLFQLDYHFTAHIDWGDGDSNRDLGFVLGLPLLGFFSLNFENVLPKFLQVGRYHLFTWENPQRWVWLPESRTFGMYIAEEYVSISIWDNPDESSSTDPWWWHIMWNYKDFFLGKIVRTEELVFEADDFVRNLPECSYPVHVTITRNIWKRPRWKKDVFIRAEIDCGEHGIPSHAGKGENSWDLDDDFTYSMTTSVTMAEDNSHEQRKLWVEEACNHLGKSILHEREKYGLPDMLKVA